MIRALGSLLLFYYIKMKYWNSEPAGLHMLIITIPIVNIIIILQPD
jgi:hypothetical protein